MPKNIFDTNRVDDLPKETRDGLSNNKLYGKTKQIYDLFLIKNPLLFDEIMVGFYRQYNLEIGRPELSAIIYKLIHKYELIHTLGQGRDRLYGLGKK